MTTIASVAVEKTAYHFDKAFDYIVPTDMPVQCGCRVVVPFGLTSKTRRLGLVLALRQSTQGEDLSPLKTILQQPDPTPILTPRDLQLLQYVKQSCFCTYFEALSALLPTGLGMRVGADTVKRKTQDQQQLYLRLLPKNTQPQSKLTPKQQKVLDTLAASPEELSLKELCYLAGVTRNIPDRLAANGFVEYYQVEVFRRPYTGDVDTTAPPVILSPQQGQAVEKLKTLCQQQKAATALLYGVTGSGKTQVFLAVIEYILAQQKSVLVLVPEISLTAQTIALFTARFGGRVAVLHSGLTGAQRLDEYKRVRTGLADIVIGTRSAVFAPLENIGLIVMDEEHESSYKSDNAPRFDAREVATYRCAQQGALLVLSSATPSVESYYKAKKGQYHLVTLTHRYGSAKLPDVYIIDKRGAQDVAEGISPQLAQELYHNLQNGQQSILLLNRRGHSTTVQCMKCGTQAGCPHCAVTLNYHKANGRMHCHYCGYSTPQLTACAICGSELVRYSGLGTQRAQEVLQGLYPNANILRMDTDTTMGRYSHDRYFADFRAGKYDILLGTQMVAKGLDFPNVTLVGVLSADQALYSDDFRAYERSFALFTQVVGRCGRGSLPGRAYIQTYTPENPVIELASTQQYPAFYKDEIATRQLHLYPPFCRLYLVGFTGVNQQAVQAAAKRFTNSLCALAKTDYPQLPVRVLGPSPAAVAKVAEKYRYKLLVKCRGGAQTVALFHNLLTQFGADKQNKGVHAFVDTSYTAGF